MDRLGWHLRRAWRRGHDESSASHLFRRVSLGATAAMFLGCSGLLVSGALSADSQIDRTQSGDVPSLARISELQNAARANALRRPTDATPWLTTAWLETVKQPKLTASANAALLRSYDLAPFGPEATTWRLGFIFDHWASAGPDVRARALKEMDVTFSRLGWTTAALSETVADPTGRMVATIAARRLRAREVLRHPPAPAVD